MPTCTRIVEFDAAHRVLGHGGQCCFLHGHRYKLEIKVAADGLDELGMVVDFAKIKQLVGSWVNERLDHNVILHPDDPLWDLYKCSLEPDSVVHYAAEVFGGREPFVMPGEGHLANPTAENIARVVLANAQLLLSPESIKVIRVRCWETPACYAEAYPELRSAKK
jgi:6-pyruvoyltetrahydropterin/6-carboxytetrahydropterin synthase